MVQESMIERIAECDNPARRENGITWRLDRECALQILAAMREPTEAMIAAGRMQDILVDLGRDETTAFPSDREVVAIYQAMIDAALAEKPE